METLLLIRDIASVAFMAIGIIFVLAGVSVWPSPQANVSMGHHWPVEEWNHRLL